MATLKIADVKAAYSILGRLLEYVANEMEEPSEEFDLGHVQVELLEAYEALEHALGEAP